MTKLSKSETHKWELYLIFAVILVIFGLVIYLVVMDEKHEDRYYGSLVFFSATAPTHPLSAEGTLESGIKTVRNALVKLVDATADVNFKVPHESDWKLTVSPQITTGTATSTGNLYYYSFPVGKDVVTDVGRLVDDVISGPVAVADLFADAPAADLAWSASAFTDTDLSVSLTYGTRDSVAVATIAS